VADDRVARGGERPVLDPRVEPVAVDVQRPRQAPHRPLAIEPRLLAELRRQGGEAVLAAEARDEGGRDMVVVRRAEALRVKPRSSDGLRCTMARRTGVLLARCPGQAATRRVSASQANVVAAVRARA